MTITLCGSIKFLDTMRAIAETLERSGHTVLLPIAMPGVDYWAQDGSARIAAKGREQLIARHMKKISESDAILVVNVTKGAVEHYVGANTFAEIMYAHFLELPVYFLNPVPDQPYIAEELAAVEPILLRGDFSRIGEVMRERL